MKIILISANGIGAGKTTLANLFNAPVLSLADGIRNELAQIYPQHRSLIMSKKQGDKDIILPSGKSVRGELIQLGESRRQNDSSYWCRLTGKDIAKMNSDTVVIDDIRKMVELSWFQLHYANVIHFHLKYRDALDEGYDDLERYADYVVERMM
jgi:hypothetical protein